MPDERSTALTEESSLRNLLGLAEASKWPELEGAWLQALSTPDLWRDAPEFDRLFELVKHRRSPSALADMLELMLDELAGNDAIDPGQVLGIFARGYAKAPASAAMRSPLVTLGRRQLDESTADAVIRRSGLNDESQTAKEAVDAFLRLYRLIPGEVCHHEYYGVGLITNVDMEGGLLKMDFPDTTYRDIPVKFEHVEELLRPMPPGNFDVLRLQNPEEVRRMAEVEPGLLVRRMAQGRNSEVAQADIKSTLTKGVFTDAEFKLWWGKKRAEVVRDPYLDVTGAGARCTFKVRSEPKPYYQEILGQFLEGKSFSARLDSIRSVLRAARDGAFPREAWEKLLPPFQQAAIEADKMAPHERLSWELLRRDLMNQAPEGFRIPAIGDPVKELESAPRAADLFMQFESIDHVQALVPAIHDAFPKEWPKYYRELAERMPPRVASQLIQTLVAEGHIDVAADTLGGIISFPERNPDTYVWATRGLLEGDLSHIPVGLDPPHLIVDLLNELESLESGPPSVSKEEEKDRRALAQKIAKLLSEKNFRLVAQVVEKMPLAEAREFYTGLDKRRLSDTFVDSMRTALRRTRNDLEEAVAKPLAATAREDVLLCTAAAHQAKLKEYKHINDVEIPANSKAIGAARELGDLRENAEYHAAKDHQKVLFRRVEELSVQLRQARVIEPKNVDTSAVTVGTKVTVKDLSDGSDRVFTVLGPWESDPTHGIISYKAPLGQSFLGRKPGEKFEVRLPSGDEHVFEVKAIEKAI